MIISGAIWVGCLRFTRPRKEFMISRWSAHYMELNCGFPSFVIIISVVKWLWCLCLPTFALSVFYACPPCLALLPECSRQWGKFAVPRNYRWYVPDSSEHKGDKMRPPKGNEENGAGEAQRKNHNSLFHLNLYYT